MTYLYILLFCVIGAWIYPLYLIYLNNKTPSKEEVKSQWEKIASENANRHVNTELAMDSKKILRASESISPAIGELMSRHLESINHE